MLEGGGFEVNDLGVDVSPEKFAADGAREKNATIVAFVGPVDHHDALDAWPRWKRSKRPAVRGQVKIMIGGALV